MRKHPVLIILILSTVVASQNRIYIDDIPVTPPFQVGFGGVWDCRKSSIYFVDNYTNFCYRYSLTENKIYRATVETNFTISFIFPSKNLLNIFFVGAGNTIIIVEWDGISDKAKFVKLVSEVDLNTGNILNHAVAGPQTEFIFGLYAQGLCSSNATQSLYQSTKYKFGYIVKTLLTGVKITSGVAIDEEINILYHLDGCTQELTAYDRDYNTGNLTNKRVVLKFNFPDYVLTVGLVIDSKGDLYTGLYGGSALVQINPRIRKYRLIEMPTAFISDPGFGGKELNILFVATGTNIPDFSTGQLNTTINKPPAGNILKVKGLGRRRIIRLPAA